MRDEGQTNQPTNYYHNGNGNGNDNVNINVNVNVNNNNSSSRGSNSNIDSKQKAKCNRKGHLALSYTILSIRFTVYSFLDYFD
ncbi:hypothetical protein BofuT4_uP016250.1 [Botrytis cinerea T4]|uniref:Uncharacterized protein n=1 Tax=Botryotinia fuckeliana (strain T4) TaxID=999810 RepID=G2YHY2_BOTF4|nr:hypothetical protein BofuT4_uP016250.1 [Botrytis cinerea T4]